MSQNVNPANPMGLPDDQMPHGYNKQNLDFNQILKQCGIADLNKLIGVSSSEDESKKKKNEESKHKADMPLPMMPGKKEKMDQKAVEKRVGLIESIMNENRTAQKKRQEADSMPQSIHAMFDALKDQQSSE